MVFVLTKEMVYNGVDYPIHCQFMVTPPASIQCSSSICRQYAETSIRSGQSGFLCDHLQSTHFLKPASNSSLSPEKLDFITNTVKWLKPERNPQPIQQQQQPQPIQQQQFIAFIVQMPWSTSSRFIHFSVFANVKVDHYWSFGNRVIVTVDTKCLKFYCKCSSGKRSCLHKCTAKWALARWNPQLLESIPVPIISDVPEEEDSSPLEEEFSSVFNEDIPEPAVSAGTPYYPPLGEVAIKMSKYIFNYKKIPPDLPLSLTVEKEDYLKRLGVFAVIFKYPTIYML